MAGVVRQAEPSVFISYRRSDAGGHAGRLYDALIRRLGREHAFMDTGNLRPGDDWARVLTDEVDGCDVLLALIGPDPATGGITGTASCTGMNDPSLPVGLEATFSAEPSGSIVTP